MAAAVASPKSLWPCQWTGDRVADELDRLVDEERRRLGRGDAQRVDHGDLVRPGLHRSCVRLHEERRIGPRGVDAEERDSDARLGRTLDGPPDAPQHVLARHAEGLELAVGDRALDHRGLDAELDERVDIRLHGT